MSNFKLMTWVIDGSKINIETSPSGTKNYYAVGNNKGFRGVCMAQSLDELYDNIKDTMGLLKRFNEERTSKG